MERLSLMMVVCLVAGLCECQARDEGSQIQITKLTHEDPAGTREVKDAVQNLGLESANRPSCEPPICAVLKELGTLEERLAATMSELEETNKRLEASEKKLAALNSLVTERTEYQGQPQVAFSAAIPIDGTISSQNFVYPLVYKHVLSNVGGHYSPDTGYFKAPVQGVYYFTFTSFCLSTTNAYCGGSLYKNENKTVSWYDYNAGHPSSRSNSAILQLQVGDHVNVRLGRNFRISDNENMYSTFSGFLLFPV